MSRRGSVSYIMKYTVQELVDMMFEDPVLLHNIRLYQMNGNMNIKTREHATNAYTAWKEKKAKDFAEELKQRELDKVNEHIETWNANHPTSFRYRTMEQIFILIRDHEECEKLAWNYCSPSKKKSKLDPELIKRTKCALLKYLLKYDPNNRKLENLLKSDQD